MPQRTPTTSPSVEIDGDRLRTQRKLRGENLKAFAARCHITVGYLSNIETGTRRRVSPETFGRICDALELRMDQRPTMVTAPARRPVKAAA